MLDYFGHPYYGESYSSWALNGGRETAACLSKLPSSEIDDLLNWVRSLPLHSGVRVNDRLYFLSHAGVNPFYGWPDVVLDEEAPDEERIAALAESQSDEDLVWVRYEFWGCPTGLVDEEGRGIVVIAGHTPTRYLETMADYPDRPGLNDEGLGQLVRVGACDMTGDVADRWDIDAGCAGGPGSGRLLMLRLDDGEEFYESVREGE
jgi:serine/threonine protein phosphatase 1